MKKMLENQSRKKDGQVVQSLATTSPEFTEEMVPKSLTILTNLNAAKWL